MIVYFALFIPIIVTGIFYLIKKHEFVWWEFFIPIGSVLIVTLITKLLIDHSSVQFTEYWGSTVTAVYEEEPYNYWKHQTCTRSVPCGTDEDGNTEYCDETYDCSHQEDVGPSWWAVTNIDERFGISEKTYDELVKQFGTGRSIVDSHENYSPRDRCSGSRGTKFEGKQVGKVSYVYETRWGGQENTRKAYVSEHRYVNKVKASDLSIFNMKVVKEEEADSLGLFEYPSYQSKWFSGEAGLQYPTILGGSVSKETQEKFKRLNGKFGPTNEMRLWVLVFENKPMSITEQQKNYWVKGNMNELVVCIGKKGNEILWADAFSWAHSDVLTVAVKNEVLNLYTYKDSLVKRNIPQVLPVGKDIQKKVLGEVGEKLPAGVVPVPKQVSADTIIKVKSSYPMLTEKTWDEYYNFLNQNLHQFQRRSFEEFNYLKVEPSTGAIIFIFIFALLVSIGINFWVINNDISE